jgi:hypothetical protein
MKATLRQHLFEISCFLVLSFGLAAIAEAKSITSLVDKVANESLIETPDSSEPFHLKFFGAFYSSYVDSVKRFEHNVPNNESTINCRKQIFDE